MPSKKSKASSSSAPPAQPEVVDAKREDESDWDYGARRRAELSNNSANSSYSKPDPNSPLVIEERGRPGG